MNLFTFPDGNVDTPNSNAYLNLTLNLLYRGMLLLVPPRTYTEKLCFHKRHDYVLRI